MGRKVTGFQIKKNGKLFQPIDRNGKVLFDLEKNSVFQTSKDINNFILHFNVDINRCEIVKVYDGEIKNPIFVDSYSYM